MNELVSVIIPVYNTAKYLDMCLESVMGQTYAELQVILVDDGSTDGMSPQKCDEWSRKDSRIQVIHKSNEGLGFTRNAGMRAAKGVFVCFLDSDDTIDSNTIEECVKTLKEQGADACYYGRKTQKADGSVFVNRNIPSKLIYTGEEVRREFAARYFGDLPNHMDLNYIQASACCAMYVRKIVAENNISFLSERECMSEDTFFNLEVCRYAEKVAIIPKDFYNYTYNVNSLTKSYNPNKINQTKSYIQYLKKYSEMYREMNRIDDRVTYSSYIYFRHAMEYEVKAWRINGVKNTYNRIQELCRDTYWIDEMKKVSALELDRKRSMFVSLFLAKQALLIMAYYMKK